jgi:hypothetical protein
VIVRRTRIAASGNTARPGRKPKDRSGREAALDRLSREQATVLRAADTVDDALAGLAGDHRMTGRVRTRASGGGDVTHAGWRTFGCDCPGLERRALDRTHRRRWRVAVSSPASGALTTAFAKAGGATGSAGNRPRQ